MVILLQTREFVLLFQIKGRQDYKEKSEVNMSRACNSQHPHRLHALLVYHCPCYSHSYLCLHPLKWLFSSFRPFDFFFEIQFKKVFKMIFNFKQYIKTCQCEQVNKFLDYFFHSKFRMNNFWTALFCKFLSGWETGKEPLKCLLFSLARASRL